jgi:transcriptional regulator with XRE-family HTH domain
MLLNEQEGNMGRPEFIIDHLRLRELREEAGKTQRQVAIELNAKLGKKNRSTEATLVRSYQRNELKGNISKERAKALAEILGVTVEVLQGKGVPEPFDYIAGIASFLRERFSAGADEALLEALERSAKTRIPSDQSIQYLAEDIGERIEAAQLGRNPSELAALAKLTGLPESELLRPANVQGHWMVIANGLGIHSTEFVRGASRLAWHVQDIVRDCLDFHGSDGSIRMFRDEPWFRLEILRNAFPNDIIRIDFVRCTTSDGTGIRWSRSSWRDRSVFEDSFRSWAYSAANFVTDFDGRQSPVGDVRRLRLLITEHDVGDAGAIHPTGRMLVSGNLDEISEQLLESCRLEKSTHALVQNWLTCDLKRSLAPYLAQHPRKCWNVSSGGAVAIGLEEHRAGKGRIHDCHFGPKYRIELVEEVGPNEFAHVPWRGKDVELLKGDIEKMLNDLDDQPKPEAEPHRKFEPYVAEG